MDRRNFLANLRNAVAAMGVGGSVDLDEKEKVFWHGKVRLRYDEFDVSLQIPTSLDDPRWKELGFDEGDVYNLALQNLIIKAQAKARATFRDTESILTAQRAARDYHFTPRRPR